MHSFLVFSSDDSMHRFLKKYLKSKSMVYTAKTPDEALQIYLNKDIDIVFFDILSENGSGTFWENFRQIGVTSTIIAIVPADQPVLMEEAMRIGAYEFLEKPLRKEVFARVLKRALERQELRRELSLVDSQMKNVKLTGDENGLSAKSGFDKQTDLSDLRYTYKEVFQKFSKALTYVYDFEKFIDLMVEALAEIFRVGRVVFMLNDKSAGVMKPYRCLGFDEVDAQNICFSGDHGVMLWLSKCHKILNKDVLDREIAAKRVTGREALSIQKEINLLRLQLCVPVFAKGSIISVIGLGNKITGKDYFDEDIELLSMLARYIGMAVENALLYQEINFEKIHHENVLENVPCGVIAINNECMVNTFNKGASKIVNISPRDVLGKNVKHIGSVFADIILRTLKDKKTFKMHEIVHPITCATYTVSTSLLLDADKELGAIMVFSDISEIKKLESMVKELEKQAFYSMLSKNMAHYVKRHLVAVKTFVELFPEKREDKEFVEQFSAVARKEISKFDCMAKKLISLGENKGLLKGKVDICLSLDQVLDFYQDVLTESKIKVIKKYAEEQVPLYGDCEKLEEALSNIILNAIEAMPDGGTLTVTVLKIVLDERKVKEVCNLLDNGAAHSKYYGTNIPKKLQMKYIEIIVGDTGQGVPQKELKNIFLPFYTTKPNNIGVGLSITKRIIEEHEGFIYFLTQEKKGSKVHILLPAQDTE